MPNDGGLILIRDKGCWYEGVFEKHPGGCVIRCVQKEIKPHPKQVQIDRYREGIKKAIDALSWPDTLAVLFSLQKDG